MDSIDSLPIDNTRKTSPVEQEVLSRFFETPSQTQTSASKWSEFKTVAIASILYLILSTSYFDKFVELLPHTGSPLFKYAIKAIIFFAVLYIAIILLN